MKLDEFWEQGGWLYYATDSNLKGYVKLSQLRGFAMYVNTYTQTVVITLDLDFGGPKNIVQFTERRAPEDPLSQAECLFNTLERYISSQ